MVTADEFSHVVRGLNDLRSTLTSAIEQGRDVRCAFYEVLPPTETTPFKEVKTPDFIKRDLPAQLAQETDEIWFDEYTSSTVIDWSRVCTQRQLVDTPSPKVKQGFQIFANKSDLLFIKKLADEAGELLGTIPHTVLQRCNLSPSTVSLHPVRNRWLAAVTECLCSDIQKSCAAPFVGDENDISGTVGDMRFGLVGDALVVIFEVEKFRSLDVFRASREVVDLLIDSVSQISEESIPTIIPDVEQNVSGNAGVSNHTTGKTGEKSTIAKNRNTQKMEWLANAMLHVQEKPHLYDSEIAELVGKHRSTLSRNQTYQIAAAKAREADAGKAKSLTGLASWDEDSGQRSVDVISPSSHAKKPHEDRGNAICGSTLFVEYCAECDDKIRVSKAKVGKSPLCDACR